MHHDREAEEAVATVRAFLQTWARPGVQVVEHELRHRHAGTRGELTVESTEDQGATFTVSLPTDDNR